MFVCTIVTTDQVPFARALADDLKPTQAEAQFVVLVITDREVPPPLVPGAEVLTIEDIGLAPSNTAMMRLGYDRRELAASIKPWLVRQLMMRGGADAVVYVDPDTWVMGDLRVLGDAVGGQAAALLPLVTDPLPEDGLEPSATGHLLRRGTFDSGLLAFGAGSESLEMLDWWGRQLLVDCVDDPDNGLYLDRRWLDLAPAMFDARVLREPAWNASYWSLHDHGLNRAPDGSILLAGRELLTLRLPGYDPRFPHLLSSDLAGRPRVRLSEAPLLRELCDAYRQRLLAVTDLEPPPAAHSAPAQEPVTDRRSRALIRHHFRQILSGRASLEFDPQQPDSLLAWLASPPTEHDDFPGLGRHLQELYRSRPDLHSAFPGVVRGDHRAFLDWVESNGVREEDVPSQLVQLERRRFRQAARARRKGLAEPAGLIPGVEVIGYLTADLGIGQAARMLVAGLEEAGVPVSTRTYTRTSSRLGAEWREREAPVGARYDTAVVCLNADMLPTFVERDGGAAILRDRYRIGFWFWELQDFPDSMMPALDPLDEVWVTSDFTAGILKERTDKPVLTAPLPVQVPTGEFEPVPELSGDPAFTFLFVFDYLSVLERKNPLGLIDAFRSAFPVPGPARLVIKSINSDRRPREQERLRYAVQDRPDIVLIERYLSRGQLDGLYHGSDCFVSLHRSEGFGFGMAEAMALGKPVIATGYSGNLTFMHGENSLLVPHSMVRVGPGCEPYPADSLWAAPDLDQAAALMRCVLEEDDLCVALGVRAAADIKREHSLGNLAAFAEARLAEIRGRADRWPDASESTRSSRWVERVARRRS
jgi:glycosyltransferase involved in cell wall biosynthesis